MPSFQTILLAIFGFFIVVAVAVFSLYKGSSGSQGQAVIWGPLPASEFSTFLNGVGLSQGDFSISYIEKNPETIEAEFTEALARGEGPDVILLQHDQIWKNRAKLVSIPFESLSERSFRETFSDGADVFLSEGGIYAVPLFVDPLVLYFNRDHLASANIAKPIEYWDEVYAAATALNKRDSAQNLVRSAIAMGEVRNISSAKEIFSLLLLQAGTPVTSFFNGELRSVLNQNFSLPVSPAESALEFFTQFANPAKSFYSWNRTLPEAQTYFASGDITYYLGFASELPIIKVKSPTLNFSVAKMPQSRTSTRDLTYGRFYGLAISRGSRVPASAFQAIVELVNKDNSLKLSQSYRLYPVRRDLLSLSQPDQFNSVFYQAALQSKAWLDPDTTETRKIFGETIESVTSGRARVSEALNNASRRLDELIKK